jgi:hypothetical protein
MVTTYTMPMCNECTAPTFDSSKPRKLSRYFEDLEQLMKCAAISDQQNMKKQVLRYVDFSTKQIWKTFPEFLDDNKTYQDFKDAILVHYPDASGDFIYSIRDMDLLIGERPVLTQPKTSPTTTYNLLQSPLGSSVKVNLAIQNNKELISELFHHPYLVRL